MSEEKETGLKIDKRLLLPRTRLGGSKEWKCYSLGGTVLLSYVRVYMEVGAAHVGFWISYFSETTEHKDR